MPSPTQKHTEQASKASLNYFPQTTPTNSTMSPAVTKLTEGLIRPAGPTPTGCMLPLSPIDKRPVFLTMMDWIHVFKHGPAPANAIKEALAKALVPYYPLAGKLARDEEGELVVACTGDGAWLTEATVDCSLAQLNYLEGSADQDPYAPISKDELLPNYPHKQDALDAVLISFQVTQFSCGGFIVGFSFNHVMLDGFGATQFLKAVGEIARGLQQPTVTPIWSRELIPPPPEITLQPNSLQFAKGLVPVASPAPFVYRAIDIPLHDINRIKHQFTQATAGNMCSTFDVLAAKIWQSQIRALGKDARPMTSLAIPTNIRLLLRHVLPSTQGYYGNCLCTVLIAKPSAHIASASLVQAVKLIRDEKEAIREELRKGIERDLTVEMLTAGMDCMGLVDQRKIGLYDVDYGCGVPTYSDPWTSFEYTPLCMITQPPPPKQGARLMTRCVRKEHIAAFCDLMTEMDV